MIFCHAVPVVPCSSQYILQTEKDGVYMAVWEGPTELLLAKVRNASGRIGIFYRCFDLTLCYINGHINDM